MTHPHLHLAPPQWVTPVEFRRDLRQQKTRIPGLSCGVVCMILRLAVLVEHRVETDRQTDTDRQTGGQTCTGPWLVPRMHSIARQKSVALASTAPGMPGTHPPNILVGGDVNGNIPPILLRTFGYSRPILLPSVRSASSLFHSAIRRHQFASVRQADSRLTRLVPPTLNSR